MKKISLAILTATAMMSGAAQADMQTVSVGYAQSKFDNFKDLRGVNVQYRYEWGSEFSAIGTFSYMSGEEDETETAETNTFKANTEVKYASLLAGPAYYINEYVTVYALGGLAYVKAESDWKMSDDESTFYRESDSWDSTSFAWGAGVLITPTEDLTVSVGYEGTRADFDGSVSINGVNLTVGYRF
jgi:putative virulence related protein PagC